MKKQFLADMKLLKIAKAYCKGLWKDFTVCWVAGWEKTKLMQSNPPEEKPVLMMKLTVVESKLAKKILKLFWLIP